MLALLVIGYERSQNWGGLYQGLIKIHPFVQKLLIEQTYGQ
jgi:hypothetical protein